jgi:hypothetical protein
MEYSQDTVRAKAFFWMEEEEEEEAEEEKAESESDEVESENMSEDKPLSPEEEEVDDGY